MIWLIDWLIDPWIHSSTNLSKKKSIYQFVNQTINQVIDWSSNTSLNQWTQQLNLYSLVSKHKHFSHLAVTEIYISNMHLISVLMRHAFIKLLFISENLRTYTLAMVISIHKTTTVHNLHPQYKRSSQVVQRFLRLMTPPPRRRLPWEWRRERLRRRKWKRQRKRTVKMMNRWWW